MTTHIQRPPTVNAHITPTGHAYTVTVLVGVDRDSTFVGYQPGKRVAPVTATPHDNTPLQLAFHTAHYTHLCQVAEAAFEVGNGQALDDTGQSWPFDVRDICVGDVLAVTDPHGTTTHLSVDWEGFTRVDAPLPEHTVPLAGTRATTRQ